MSLTYSKCVKGLYLLLLTSSSILSFIKPTFQTSIIAVLAVAGFVAFDTICYFRDKHKQDDSKVKAVSDRLDKLEKEIADIKGDHSLAHLAATFKRK